MKKKEMVHFVVCLDNEGYPAPLDVGKLYRRVPDREAEAEGLLRVVDESGEDYGFEAKRFHEITVPPVLKRGKGCRLTGGAGLDDILIDLD